MDLRVSRGSSHLRVAESVAEPSLSCQFCPSEAPGEPFSEHQLRLLFPNAGAYRRGVLGPWPEWESALSFAWAAFSESSSPRVSSAGRLMRQTMGPSAAVMLRTHL